MSGMTEATLVVVVVSFEKAVDSWLLVDGGELSGSHMRFNFDCGPVGYFSLQLLDDEMPPTKAEVDERIEQVMERLGVKSRLELEQLVTSGLY